jgi:hypothetical protein
MRLVMAGHSKAEIVSAINAASPINNYRISKTAIWCS